MNELESRGYKVNGLGGYSARNVAGTNKPSYHSQGAAIDINPGQNPVGAAGNLPPDIGALAAKYGLGWGGNWTSKKDPMHFSIAQQEGGSAPIGRFGVGPYQSASNVPTLGDPSAAPQLGRGIIQPISPGARARVMTPQEVASMGQAPGTVMVQAPDGSISVPANRSTAELPKGDEDRLNDLSQGRELGDLVLRAATHPTLNGADAAWAAQNGGQMFRLGGGSGGAGGQPVVLNARNADAVYAQLPPGALFVGPDGLTRRKPGAR